MPSKIYGKDTSARRDRILNTFEKRPRSTGVMLTGEKGSGKTLMIKSIACEAISRGISVIQIQSGLGGPAFNKLLADLQTPCVIVFDEFEKLYDGIGENESGHKTSMEELLTLLDGTVKCKHLFLFSSNNTSISRFMKNRPGRIYYIYEYSALGLDVIEDYAKENLNDKTKLAEYMLLARRFFQFNFDMMQALVEEMNLYGESAEEACEHLNIKLKFEDVNYSVKVFVNNAEASWGDVSGNRFFTTNPFKNQESRLSYNITIFRQKVGKNEYYVNENFMLDRRSLTNIDENGTSIFNFTVDAKKIKELFNDYGVAPKIARPETIDVEFRLVRESSVTGFYGVGNEL